ncbi:MAG TPA: hypothetical protein VND21_03200, partial [Planctomycetota bacterium]|nr:hypothetical protein [Planctomycetota bacterium]
PDFVPTCVALADVVGDGELDAIVGGDVPGSGQVWILVGAGDGTFSLGVAGTFILTGTSLSDLAVGNMVTVSDGSADVVARAGSLVVVISDKDGPWTVVDSSTVADGGGRIHLADMGGTTDLDAVVSNANTDSVSVFLGDGLGAIGSALTTNVGDEPLGFALADLSGDGEIDLVIAEDAGLLLRALVGAGNGGFNAGSDTFPVGGAAHDVVLDTFDAGGVLDAAVARVGGVHLLLGQP